MTQINKMADQSPEKRKRCYIQARGFFFAAKRCGRVEICEESGSPQYLPIPEYVNIAFSCELYLKALLYRDDEIINGHSLLDLFSRLDVASRHRVSEILKIDEAQIKNLLEQHSNLFRNMRYRFEYPQYSGSFSVPLQFFYLMVESLDQLVQ
ncbi:MAG: hypothetical protein ACYDG2_17200 [Ruminiclostridium sp.]